MFEQHETVLYMIFYHINNSADFNQSSNLLTAYTAYLDKGKKGDSETSMRSSYKLHCSAEETSKKKKNRLDFKFSGKVSFKISQFLEEVS